MNQNPNRSGNGTAVTQALMSDAVKRHDAGDLKQAQMIYQQVLAIEPNHPVALNLLGKLALQVGQFDVAIDLIGKALTQRPDYAEAHYFLGNAFIRAKAMDKAVASFEKALQYKPDYTDALCDLGNVWTHLSRLEDAIRVYQKALSINPNLAMVHSNLGVVLKKSGRLSDAVSSFEKSIALNPGHADAHSNLGNALKELDRPDDARRSFEAAIALKPDLAAAHNNLGNVLVTLNRMDDAMASYRKALDINPRFEDAHANRGALLQKLGHLNEAVSSCQKAVDINPDYEIGHYNLANTLADSGRLDEAVDHFHKAIGLNPAYREAYKALGIVQLSRGNMKEVIADCEQAIRAIPDFKDAFYMQGVAQSRLGQIDDAIRNLKRADTTKSRKKLLECLYSIGDEERFFEALAEIMSADTTNVGVAAITAFAAQQFGREDPYPFCPNPLDFVYEGHLGDLEDRKGGLLDSLQTRISGMDLDGRHQVLVKSGTQSSGNIFNETQGGFAELKVLIEAEIARYRERYQGSDCQMIRKWPKMASLQGWYVLLEPEGHLTTHNHEEGWLSGVTYLTMPRKSGDEGNIEFGLHGDDYPIRNASYPIVTYNVNQADIMLFPSSLYHRTIPFHSDEKRLCVAFDLVPSG